MSKLVPVAVIEAIQRKFLPDIQTMVKVLNELQYDSLNDNYYFYYAGMYHGVENDGYIHT